jgi:hypothetical protein
VSAKALDGIRSKIERAEQHISDFDSFCDRFFFDHRYSVRYEDDPQTGLRTVYMVSVPEVPSAIAVIAGDAVQNLRSALDHLAHELVVIGTGDPGPHRHIYFPIFDSVQEYHAGKTRRIKGMNQDAIDAIDRTEPYRAGNKDPNNTLWCLNALNNVDKHRLLLTVASQYESHSLMPSQVAEIRRRYYGSYSP